jgi:hypothetical protein
MGDYQARPRKLSGLPKNDLVQAKSYLFGLGLYVNGHYINAINFSVCFIGTI